MSKNRKSKVKLPTDRNGESIHIGDVIVWEDGSTVKVRTLTYYGDEFELLGSWIANEQGTTDEDYSDNLCNGEIVWRAK